MMAADDFNTAEVYRNRTNKALDVKGEIEFDEFCEMMTEKMNGRDTREEIMKVKGIVLGGCGLPGMVLFTGVSLRVVTGVQAIRRGEQRKDIVPKP